MKIKILQGRIEGDEIVTPETPEEIRQRIDRHEVVIVRGTFDKSRLAEVRKRVFSFGQNTPENNPEQRSAQTEQFHRIDHNHPKMLVQRIAHFFRYSYKHQGEEDVFSFMHPINLLRNRVAGLPVEYTFFTENNGYLSQPALLHYPQGGGYMAAHTDPLEPQMVETVLALSQRGVDFESGGLEILDGDKWVDVEAEIQMGDICMFKPDVPHRVLPIDVGRDLSWSNPNGRWIMFSPIAHVDNKGTTEKMY